MSTYAINTASALKDRKKSKRIALAVHLLAALLLLIPIASQIDLEKTPPATQVVMVDFNDFKAASAKSSAKAGVEETKPAEVKEPVEEAKPAEVVTPEPEKPKEPVKTVPVVKTEQPVKIKTTRLERPEKVKTKTKTTKVPVKVKTKAPAKVKTKAPASEKKPTGSQGETGVGTQGSSTTGDAKTDGKVDDGKQGMDFEGDALFTRRVIRRADIKQLSTKKGTIVVNLCVDQNGSVVYADFNKSASNIYDKNLVTEAVQATKQYRFEPDYTAPLKQCGKLTFIIKIK